MSVTEEQLRSWARPPSQTEETKCSNAENSIKKAIKASEKLSKRNIRVFTQGSYANNTNARRLSDVDVAILCKDIFFYQLPEGRTADSFGITPASYKFSQFKSEVHVALVDYFGQNNVKRGNKAFDIDANSYHVEADVAPFFDHLRYNDNGTILAGVQLFSDTQDKVINWPDQHMENGRSKNKTTGGRFKSMVRIAKVLNDRLDESVPGFLLECLFWNVPNSKFGNPLFETDLRKALFYLWEELNKATSDEWGEVSELKYLFRATQPWTKQTARKNVKSIWNEAGLG